MRPTADDVRLARWLCAVAMRVAAVPLLLCAGAGFICRWGAFSHARMMANAGLAPPVSIRETFRPEWACLAIALGLLAASFLLIRFLVPSGGRIAATCPACGYDVTGLAGKPCPECGKA